MRRLRFGLRSLRNRLAVVFGLIVLGAIGTVYLSVTPRLQERLRDQRLQVLATDAKRMARELPDLPADADDVQTRKLLASRLRRQAARVGAEILVVTPIGGSPEVLSPLADSTPDGGLTLIDVHSVAAKALRTRRTATGTEPTSMGQEALAAQPLSRNRGVVILSDSLADVEANVGLIRRQILYSGALALLI